MLLSHLDADIIVHVGDFVRLHRDNATKQIKKFTHLCEQAGKPYVLVLGNHDYYDKPMGLIIPKSYQVGASMSYIVARNLSLVA
ncbi:MAG: metallophosphoesterase [Moraxella sp.]|nr:metallophosphoesterase [Moraxella sp.]